MFQWQKFFKGQIVTPFFVGVLILVGFSRYLPLENPWLFNFSPTLAIFLFCGAFLQGRWGWTVPLVAIVLSDLFLNPTYGSSFLEPFMFATLGSYWMVWFLGKKIGNQSSLTVWTTASISSALLFHGITCTLAWAVNPAYTKSIFGLIQAIFIGEPGYAPSYLFLRNSILGTLFFATAFRWAHFWFTNKFSSAEPDVIFCKNVVGEPQINKHQ